MAARFGWAEWNGPPVRNSEEYWQQPIRWNRKAAKLGVRSKVFPSGCDPFDNQAPAEWREDMFAVIRETPHLDWLLLTKRPQNITPMLLPMNWQDGWDNVWLGTSVENQTEADRRIPHLLAVPARVHFLSCEPLLGPLELWSDYYWRMVGPGAIDGRVAIDWVIAGGESGPNARPCHPDWIRQLRDQCATAGVPFFFKQIGSNGTGWPGISGKGRDPEKWPSDLRVREFPEHA
jgi:protein gp37